MKRHILALVLVLGLTAPLAAGQYEDGNAAYHRGDFASAYELWQPLAEKGSAAAQTRLGWLYLHGQGVPQDYFAAVKWFRLAAEQGLAVAQGVLGSMNAGGLGVAKNYAEAMKWYGLAAEQGEL